MEFRYLTAEDAGEWLRLRLQALLGDPEDFSASFEEYQPLNLEDVRKRLGFDEKDAFVVGAFDDGRLQGCAGFYRDHGLKSRHKGRVWGVYVTPERRRRGSRKEDDDDAAGAKRRAGWRSAGITFRGSNPSCSLTPVPFGRIHFIWTEPRALKIGDRFIDEEYMFLRVS